jgi:hypothetical protein
MITIGTCCRIPGFYTTGRSDRQCAKRALAGSNYSFIGGTRGGLSLMQANLVNQGCQFVATDDLLALITVVDENLQSTELLHMLSGVFNCFSERAEGPILLLNRPAMHCTAGSGIY